MLQSFPAIQWLEVTGHGNSRHRQSLTDSKTINVLFYRHTEVKKSQEEVNFMSYTVFITAID